MRIIGFRTAALCFIFACASFFPAFAEKGTVKLRLAGSPVALEYVSLLLTRALEAQGYSVKIDNLGYIPTTRLEVMLKDGDISAYILGETPERMEKFLPVRVSCTDNLMGHRILFIRPEDQPLYDTVKTLEDFKALGKTAGMGEAWGDVLIWKKNGLAVQTQPGEWKHLYNMVAAGGRGVDYLPRGAQEMAAEWREHPELAVEKNLVFVYPRDHLVFVTPREPGLHALLEKALQEAESSGLIRDLARDFYGSVYEPPVNLKERIIIPLELP